MPVSDGMVVRTTSDVTIKARKGVMEFLLVNHPLDCPVCDEGGECQLQDLAFAFGQDFSRMESRKRTFESEDLGPSSRRKRTAASSACAACATATR
jgi:NADH-quinone oxidoreductase subunit G